MKRQMHGNGACGVHARQFGGSSGDGTVACVAWERNVTNTESLRVSVVKFGLLFYKNKLVDLKELVV